MEVGGRHLPEMPSTDRTKVRHIDLHLDRTVDKFSAVGGSSMVAADRSTSVELNLNDVVTAVAARYPQRPAIVRGERALTYSELVERGLRLARFLHDNGLGSFAERAHLQGHQSGQHMLAQCLHNGVEYVEGLLGSYRARVAPFNVNYLYRSEELLYLLGDAMPAAIQFHSAFAPALAEVLPRLSSRPLLLQVQDGSGESLLPGAVDYEDALASVEPEVSATPTPDDLYVIYTGGTTGMPKGVLWRQADVAVATLGLTHRRERREYRTLGELVDTVRHTPVRILPCAPLMHGASQWAALGCLGQGNTIVFPEAADSFDASGVLAAVERHQVNVLTIVGDAFAQPLVAALEQGDFDVSSLSTVVSGGAALHAGTRRRLQQLVTHLRVVENIGSSESGIQGSRRSQAAHSGTEPFTPDRDTVVVAEDFTSILTPGDEVTGWLARGGRVPLGYLGDPAKTARTFPVVDGRRLTIPGDRVRLLGDGRMELLGRDSLTINTGGEKVFVEEVEGVLKHHPSVIDALVCGRPSPRWGSEVAAVVEGTSDLDASSVLEFCRDRLARYKVPKSVHVVERIRRNAAGKGDYRWAARQVGPQESIGTSTQKDVDQR